MFWLDSEGVGWGYSVGQMDDGSVQIVEDDFALFYCGECCFSNLKFQGKFTVIPLFSVIFWYM